MASNSINEIKETVKGNERKGSVQEALNYGFVSWLSRKENQLEIYKISHVD
jgi:hypothetical protein